MGHGTGTSVFAKALYVGSPAHCNCTLGSTSSVLLSFSLYSLSSFLSLISQTSFCRTAILEQLFIPLQAATKAVSETALLHGKTVEKLYCICVV